MNYLLRIPVDTFGFALSTLMSKVLFQFCGIYGTVRHLMQPRCGSHLYIDENEDWHWLNSPLYEWNWPKSKFMIAIDDKDE